MLLLQQYAGNAAVVAALGPRSARRAAICPPPSGVALLQRVVISAGRHRFDIGDDPVRTLDDLAVAICKAAKIGDVHAISRLLSNADVAAVKKGQPLLNKKLLKALNEMFPPEPVADPDELAKHLLQERGMSAEIAPLLVSLITQRDVDSYNKGGEFENKKLNSALAPAGLVNLRLRHEHPQLRPWLRNMYTHGAGGEKGAGHVVLALGISAAGLENTTTELGELHASTPKGKTTSPGVRDLLSDALNKITGRVAVTFVGHINYGGSPDPAAWTLGELSVKEIANALQEAFADHAKDTTLAQVNLLSCGSEQFGRLLVEELEVQGLLVRFCTAFRDSIPVTPGPLGTPKPEYLFTGDLKSYQAGRGENISSSVVFIHKRKPPRDLIHFVEGLIGAVLRQAEPRLPDEVVSKIVGFALPGRPSQAAIEALKHTD